MNKLCILIFLILISFNVKANEFNFNNFQDDALFVEFYSIPSPDEVLSYIHNNEIKYTPKILAPNNNIQKFRTTTDKLLALGVFLADMAYAISFENTTTALNYYETVEALGKNLNIITTEIEDLGARIIKNLGVADSISDLYDEIYLSLMGNLHDTGRFGEYAIISASGFVESLHLAINSDKDQQNVEEFNKRVWEQKMILDQLEAMFERYLSANMKKNIQDDIAELSNSLNEYISHKTTTSSSTIITGAVLIGVEKPKEYDEFPPIDEIVKNIDTLRKKWIK